MNWGWKIVVLYSLFIGMTLFMVFFFMRQKVDLVADDYYKQEIEYQGQIDKITNAKSLKEPVGFEYLAESRIVKFNFPQEHADNGVKGNIHFYRPSNADEDKKIGIKTESNGVQVIGVRSLNKGLWKVKISWVSGGKGFYDEKVITL